MPKKIIHLLSKMIKRNVEVVVKLSLAIVFLLMDKCGSSRKTDELKGEHKRAIETAKAEKMIKEEIVDYNGRIFYICGPPKMVQSLTDILKNKLGVEDEKIKIENFVGY